MLAYPFGSLHSYEAAIHILELQNKIFSIVVPADASFILAASESDSRCVGRSRSTSGIHNPVHLRRALRPAPSRPASTRPPDRSWHGVWVSLVFQLARLLFDFPPANTAELTNAEIRCGTDRRSRSFFWSAFSSLGCSSCPLKLSA